MGLLGTMSAIGTALGPSLGGALIDGLGWPSLFFLNLPLGALALVLAWRCLPSPPVATDPAATASPARWAIVWREPGLGAGLAMSALVSTVMMATLVVGPFHLARAFGLAAAGAGLVMSAGPVVSALAGVPAGRWVDRLGAARMTIIGLAGMAGGSLGLALVPESWGIGGYVLPLVVLTAHYALFQAANNTAVMNDVAADRRGVVAGMLNLSRLIGLVAGASLMGGVFAFAGMPSTFLLATGLVAAAGLVALRLPRRVLSAGA
jgi:MFS family permease